MSGLRLSRHGRGGHYNGAKSRIEIHHIMIANHDLLSSFGGKRTDSVVKTYRWRQAKLSGPKSGTLAFVSSNFKLLA